MSIIGIHVLYRDVYYDLEILIYCCVIAASQYSLLKSCQPDVNTPVHVNCFFFFNIFFKKISRSFRVTIVIQQSVVQFTFVCSRVYFYAPINSFKHHGISFYLVSHFQMLSSVKYSTIVSQLFSYVYHYYFFSVFYLNVQHLFFVY